MILPNKYITLSESLIGISALILDVLKARKLTIELLWDGFIKKYLATNKTATSQQKFLLALDFMYLTGMINYNEEGEIFNENLQS